MSLDDITVERIIECGLLRLGKKVAGKATKFEHVSPKIDIKEKPFALGQIDIH